MDFDETDCAFSYRDPARSDLSSTSLLLALPELQLHALRVLVLLLLTLRDLRLGLGRGSATLRLLGPIRLKRLEDLPGNQSPTGRVSGERLENVVVIFRQSKLPVLSQA